MGQRFHDRDKLFSVFFAKSEDLSKIKAAVVFAFSHLFISFFIFIFFRFMNESGIITFGDTVDSNCPLSQRNFDRFQGTVFAVYWIPARVFGRDSEIFFRMNLTNEEKFNKTEVEGFVSEINQARDSDVKVDDIRSVIYITWFNLKQFPEVLAEVSTKYVSFLDNIHLFSKCIVKNCYILNQKICTVFIA